MNQERLAELAEVIKEHNRQALYHQQEAYFNMCEFLELVISGDEEEAARIRKITKKLKIL